MQRAHTRIATPGEGQPVGASHADHLVVDQVRRHADEVQVAPALPDDLVPCREGNQVGEALQRHALAVTNMTLDGIG